MNDEQTVRTFVKRVLVNGGYEVVDTADGPEALEIVERESAFDLFVIDVVMPGMRGDELGRQLMQRDPETKIPLFHRL
jgi:CheY-like chemotaxis protein